MDMRSHFATLVGPNAAQDFGRSIVIDDGSVDQVGGLNSEFVAQRLKTRKVPDVLDGVPVPPITAPPEPFFFGIDGDNQRGSHETTGTGAPATTRSLRRSIVSPANKVCQLTSLA